jgi:hypothetical protein
VRVTGDVRRTILWSFIFILALSLVLSSTCLALSALPDIGIDYQTMTVVNAVKLRAAGMPHARNGDKILISHDQDSKLILINERTGETLRFGSSH